MHQIAQLSLKLLHAATVYPEQASSQAGQAPRVDNKHKGPASQYVSAFLSLLGLLEPLALLRDRTIADHLVTSCHHAVLPALRLCAQSLAIDSVHFSHYYTNTIHDSMGLSEIASIIQYITTYFHVSSFKFLLLIQGEFAALIPN